MNNSGMWHSHDDPVKRMMVPINWGFIDLLFWVMKQAEQVDANGF